MSDKVRLKASVTRTLNAEGVVTDTAAVDVELDEDSVKDLGQALQSLLRLASVHLETVLPEIRRGEPVEAHD